MQEPASAVATTIEATNTAYYTNFARVPGGELRREQGATWFVSGAPYEGYNGVVGAELNDNIDTRIAALLAVFTERDVPMLWHCGPGSRPIDLPARLLAHGLVHIEDEPGMALDLTTPATDGPLPAGLSITQVLDEEIMRTWVDVYCLSEPRCVALCYDVHAPFRRIPDGPLRYYLGRLEGEPVGVASLFEHERVASIQHVVTRPHARRRGIGRALTQAVLRTARQRGHTLAVLTAAPLGQGIYERLGFRAHCVISRYRWPAGG